MLLSAHFLVYGVDGVGLKSTHLLGRILEAAAELMFILLLILIAKGYTVTRARLPQASSMKLAVFVCSYCVIYCTLFIYERISFDTGQVSYLFIHIEGGRSPINVILTNWVSTKAPSLKLAVFVCSYCVIYFTLFIYERIGFDTGQVEGVPKVSRLTFSSLAAPEATLEPIHDIKISRL